jgi:hypothetical protein
MANAFLDTSLTGIGDVLKERRLAVPVYQRSYSWEDEQVEELWDDIASAVDIDAPEYFLGTVVLTGNSADEYDASVIDGQQRLATTSLLLVALRDAYLAANDVKRAELIEDFLFTTDPYTLQLQPRLSLNTEDAHFFEVTTLRRPDEREALAPSARSHRRIARALELLNEKVTLLAAENAGEQWFQPLVALQLYVQKQARVIVLDVADEANAFQIFETLNDRGLALTIADLLKNYLFGQAGNKLEQVKQSWERSIGALELTDNDELQTTFLRQYWSSVNGPTREKELYNELKRNIVGRDKAVEFASDLEKAARVYAAMQNRDHEFWKGYGTRTKDNLETLLRLEVSQYRPLLLAVMQQWSEPEIKKVLERLVTWSVRLIVSGRAGSGTVEKAFATYAVDIRKGEIKRTGQLDKKMAAVMPDDEQFRAAFAVTPRKPKIIRYFLIALERAAAGEASPELVPNADESQMNAEHIIPRNATIADWPGFTPELHAQLVNTLGNQALLRSSDNSALGAKDFATKAKIYGGSQLILTSEIAKEIAWTPDAIRDRQQRLAQLAVATWPL